MNDLVSMSAYSLAKAIRRRDVSSLDVTRAFIDRIEAVNPRLNAVVQTRYEAAFDEARRKDTDQARGVLHGPLHGVPMTIKDSLETEDLITTAGTTGLRHHLPERDATVVARLKSAGAILLGKTNTPELTLRFVTDNYVYGRTSNPYDLERSPAGSSGGAAAIVAAGGAAFDIGTDYAGSIRMPAHVCGIAGLKPTGRRVPRSGHIPFLEMGATEAFISVGPLARKVEDLDLILRIIAGPDTRDPFVVPGPIDASEAVVLKTLRVALFTDNGVTPASPDTTAVVEAAGVSLMNLGAGVERVRPPGIDTAPELWMRLVLADGGHGIRVLLKNLGTQRMHPLLDWSLARAPSSSEEMAEALVDWNRLRAEGLSFLDRHDVILSPVSATPATLHEAPAAVDYTHLYSLLGWPVAVVRCGTSREGLPIGVQIAGGPWREDLVLAVARHLELTFGGWQAPAI